MFVGIACPRRIPLTNTSSAINFTRKIHTRALYIAEMVDKKSIVSVCERAWVCVCVCVYVCGMKQQG